MIGAKTGDSSNQSEIAHKVKLKYMISEMEEINEESYESDHGQSIVGSKKSLTIEKSISGKKKKGGDFVPSVSASGAFERFLSAPIQKEGSENEQLTVRNL